MDNRTASIVQCKLLGVQLYNGLIKWHGRQWFFIAGDWEPLAVGWEPLTVGWYTNGDEDLSSWDDIPHEQITKAIALIQREMECS